jgi:hypothetical protein
MEIININCSSPLGEGDFMRVETNDAGFVWFQTSGDGGVGPHVKATPDDLRRLRDLLNETLGEVSPPPAQPAPKVGERSLTAFPMTLLEALRNAHRAYPEACAAVADALLGDILDAARAAGLVPESAKPDLSGYMAPCPEGYGTVLGHLVQQGRFPEDLGVAEGQRLARIAKEAGVARVWVDVAPALAAEGFEVCDRVRAYPAAFLAEHLGPVA